MRDDVAKICRKPNDHLPAQPPNRALIEHGTWAAFLATCELGF
jgi:hypothetical protein